ncbi:MAG: DUF952 domain-containing protein [Pseudomonadota bacterium]
MPDHRTYKVLRAKEASDLVATAHFDGSADDQRDGFIHLSTEEQVPGTLAKHFAGEESLFLALCIFASDDDALKWEGSRGGALFPHLYRKLTVWDVRALSPLPKAKDRGAGGDVPAILQTTAP